MICLFHRRSFLENCRNATSKEWVESTSLVKSLPNLSRVEAKRKLITLLLLFSLEVRGDRRGNIMNLFLFVARPGQGVRFLVLSRVTMMSFLRIMFSTSMLIMLTLARCFRRETSLLKFWGDRCSMTKRSLVQLRDRIHRSEFNGHRRRNCKFLLSFPQRVAFLPLSSKASVVREK